MAESTNLVNLPVLTKFVESIAFRKKKSCERYLVESTTLFQRQIHGDVCTERIKEVDWRISASECYGLLLIYDMLKTYLDWNIIADLRDDKLSLSLGDFTNKYKFSTLFPYSNVHFQDLYNRGRRDVSRVQTDLSIIDKVSNSFYLAYDEKEDQIETQYGSAVDYYKHYKSESFIYKVAETFIDTLGKFLLSKDYIRKAQKLLGLDPKVVNNEQDVI